MQRKGMRTLVVLVAIVVFIFGLNSIFKFRARASMVTDSTNPRFNQYVSYFSRQKGYIVEYKNFSTFPDDVDVMYKPVGSLDPAPLMEIVFCKTVKLYTLGREFEGGEFEAMCTMASLEKPVTVYYDDEQEVIFFIGDYYCSRFFYAARAADRTATYGYYTTFTAR
ncbi:hypothetical protein AC480_06335 [miscellaneous Crenarchaeota group archaeon SMTZ1-55]|nr:MAG: hypothetical protein AC480_06335 [miscellaneous Crenarchaeota group archaeon SMTZ1-55]